MVPDIAKISNLVEINPHNSENIEHIRHTAPGTPQRDSTSNFNVSSAICLTLHTPDKLQYDKLHLKADVHPWIHFLIRGCKIINIDENVLLQKLNLWLYNAVVMSTIVYNFGNFSDFESLKISPYKNLIIKKVSFVFANSLK